MKSWSFEINWNLRSWKLRFLKTEVSISDFVLFCNIPVFNFQFPTVQFSHVRFYKYIIFFNSKCFNFPSSSLKYNAFSVKKHDLKMKSFLYLKFWEEVNKLKIEYFAIDWRIDNWKTWRMKPRMISSVSKTLDIYFSVRKRVAPLSFTTCLSLVGQHVEI